ncbi:MAG: hypothetical protein GY817_09390, partial [bacterium]|nr:hypothetical protein [bacterium]
MIDTIALTIKGDEFKITDNDKFSPSTYNLFKYNYSEFGSKQYLKYVQNPTKKDMLRNYKPKLTITKRKNNDISLRVEFSAPKLLYSNNFFELENKDFKKLVDILFEKLKSIGIKTTKKAIENANVSAIHYSKNFVLEKGITVSLILDYLHKLELNYSLDINKTNYRNNGYSLTYHSNSYEIAFYDKIKDLEKSRISEKRALENNSFTQQELTNTIIDKNHMEVLREEIRLNNRKKIKPILKELGFEIDLIFKNLFNSKIAIAVLLYYWQKITENFYLLSFKQDDTVLEKINDIMQNETNINKGLKNLGATYLFDAIGLNGLKSIVKSYSNSKTSQRITSDFKKIKFSQNGRIKSFLIAGIEKELK